MSYLETVSKSLAIEITQPRRYNYSQASLEDFLAINPELTCCPLAVRNSRSEQLDAILIKQPKATSCIVYAHGLGSNKLEALPMARYLKAFDFDVCCFDFSSSGRSEGQHTGYGVREQEDVRTILNELDGVGRYERYVLWGRSMGAVAVVLSQTAMLHRKVQCMVLDSPFSSFEKIAIELASKKSYIPQFMLGVLIEPLKTYFHDHHPVDPFQIDLCSQVARIDCRMLLIYSKTDSVVGHSHSLAIASHCRRLALEVEIQEDHNMQRSRSTHQKVLAFIRDCIDEHTRNATRLSKNKSRGISLASKDKHPRGKSMLTLCSRHTDIDRDTDGQVLASSVNWNNHSQLAHHRHAAKQKLRTSDSYCREQESDVVVMSTVQTMPATRESLCWQSKTSQKKTVRINSIFMEAAHANKENKPSLNLMRKNRFR